MSTRPFSPRRLAFVDSSATYALLDPTDRNHRAAQAILERLERERWRLFTTNFVVAEAHALILNRLNRHVALRYLLEIDQSSITIVRLTPADERHARTIVATYQDKDFSLTDATSFAVMERLGISTAFTFDRNFAQYGFTLLTPERAP